jgi:hypothetical protein
MSVEKSLDQVVLDFESKMKLAIERDNDDIPPNRNRYIPPARRRSPIGQPTSSPSSPTLSLSPDPAEQKMKRIMPSSRWSHRTPSPTNPTPPVVKDKESGELVEVWQGKRSGGNRAPKIEPAGTKSWRKLPKQSRSPEPRLVEITNPAQPNRPLQVLPPLEMPFREITHLRQQEREMPFHRWPRYSSDVLDVIDIQLNVVNRCIAPTSIVPPEGLELSVRFIPTRAHPILENAGITPEISYISREMLLPGWITTVDFYNILLSVLESLQITLPELVLLLRYEGEFGEWTWKDTTDINEMLYSFAISQINCKCSLDLFQTRHLGDDDDRRKAYLNRDSVHCQEVANVQNYITKENTYGWEGFERDVNQLMQDYATGRIDHKDLRFCFKCLECHWNGPVQGVPDYLKMLHMAGYGPGIRGPIQLPNRKELPWIYEQVNVWLERKRIAEYNYSMGRYQPQLNMISHIYD